MNVEQEEEVAGLPQGGTELLRLGEERRREKAQLCSDPSPQQQLLFSHSALVSVRQG